MVPRVLTKNKRGTKTKGPIKEVEKPTRHKFPTGGQLEFMAIKEIFSDTTKLFPN